MEFNIILDPDAKVLFYLTAVSANKRELFSTYSMRNASNIHPRLGSILDLCRTFPNGPARKLTPHDNKSIKQY